MLSGSVTVRLPTVTPLAEFSATEQLTELLYAALMPAARVLVDNVAADQRDQILGWTNEMLSDMVGRSPKDQCQTGDRHIRLKAVYTQNPGRCRL